MNNKKTSNHVRLIAFFLTATTLICTFGLTVDGWQASNKENLAEGESVDNSKTDTLLPDKETSSLPKFYSYLTGLVTVEANANSRPLAFVMDNENSTYGISGADLLVEIPIENGKTRYVAFISNQEDLWKVGSITHTRGYINNVIKAFGGIGIYSECDDMIIYESCDITNQSVDLSIKNDYHYTEQSSKIFTNSNLLLSAIDDCGINTDVDSSKVMPFCFDDSKVEFNNKAWNVSVGISDNSYIQLKFDASVGTYTYIKNGATVIDQSSNKSLGFTNCFILFADSTIYDRSSGQHLVMDTIGNGEGFCLTGGTYERIKWSIDQNGTIKFTTLDDNDLIINRGNSYISIIPSSRQYGINFAS